MQNIQGDYWLPSFAKEGREPITLSELIQALENDVSFWRTLSENLPDTLPQIPNAGGLCQLMHLVHARGAYEGSDMCEICPMYLATKRGSGCVGSPLASFVLEYAISSKFSSEREALVLAGDEEKETFLRGLAREECSQRQRLLDALREIRRERHVWTGGVAPH